MGGAGLAMPGLIGVSGCSRQLFNPDAGTGLSLGYVSGDVSADSALVWLRAEAGSRVVLDYGKEPGLAQFQTDSSARRRSRRGSLRDFFSG